VPRGGQVHRGYGEVDDNRGLVVQDLRLAAVAATADRVAQRLLASPLAVAQFFAHRVIGGWFLPGESIPEEFEARTAPQSL
jgi:hypothetical protein